MGREYCFVTGLVYYRYFTTKRGLQSRPVRRKRRRELWGRVGGSALCLLTRQVLQSSVAVSEYAPQSQHGHTHTHTHTHHVSPSDKPTSNLCRSATPYYFQVRVHGVYPLQPVHHPRGSGRAPRRRQGRRSSHHPVPQLT